MLVRRACILEEALVLNAAELGAFEQLGREDDLCAF